MQRVVSMVMVMAGPPCVFLYDTILPVVLQALLKPFAGIFRLRSGKAGENCFQIDIYFVFCLCYADRRYVDHSLRTDGGDP